MKRAGESLFTPRLHIHIVVQQQVADFNVAFLSTEMQRSVLTEQHVTVLSIPCSVALANAFSAQNNHSLD
jgi:hypothetical protein